MFNFLRAAAEQFQWFEGTYLPTYPGINSEQARYPKFGHGVKVVCQCDNLLILSFQVYTWELSQYPSKKDVRPIYMMTSSIFFEQLLEHLDWLEGTCLFYILRNY